MRVEQCMYYYDPLELQYLCSICRSCYLIVWKEGLVTLQLLSELNYQEAHPLRRVGWRAWGLGWCKHISPSGRDDHCGARWVECTPFTLLLWYSPHSFWTPDSSVCVVVSTLSVDFSTRKCQHHCTLVFMYTMVYMESYQSWKLWSSENICPGDKNPPKHQCVVMLASPCTCTWSQHWECSPQQDSWSTVWHRKSRRAPLKLEVPSRSIPPSLMPRPYVPSQWEWWEAHTVWTRDWY